MVKDPRIKWDRRTGRLVSGPTRRGDMHVSPCFLLQDALGVVKTARPLSHHHRQSRCNGNLRQSPTLSHSIVCGTCAVAGLVANLPRGQPLPVRPDPTPLQKHGQTGEVGVWPLHEKPALLFDRSFLIQTLPTLPLSQLFFFSHPRRNLGR